MSRPRIPIGTFGDFRFIATKTGRVSARALFRDWDGTNRQVAASGATKAAAERALKIKLNERNLFRPVETTVTADSTFEQLAEYWLEDVDLENRISAKTRECYDWHLRKVVLPVFGKLALREIGVARCDTFIKGLARQSYSKARQARVVMRLVFGLAVRHEILPRNPMDGIARLHRPPHEPDALTPVEVNAVRMAVQFWAMRIPGSRSSTTSAAMRW